MKASQAFAVLFLSGALSGCGTVVSVFCDSDVCGKLEPYSGTRLVANGHATQLDVPFSFVLDTALLPLTVPKMVVDRVIAPEAAAEAGTGTAQQKASPRLVTSLLSPAPFVADDSVVVYLVPMDDFPFEETARLARMLADDLQLNVKASPPMAYVAATPLNGGAQYPVDEILAETRTSGRRLLNAGDKVVLIALTRRDINDRAPGLNFLFSKHDLTHHVSVISTARMLPRTDRGQDRLYKMTKRTIGEQHFGMKRSTDRRDIMYAPILSLDDVDAMGREFLQGALR